MAELTPLAPGVRAWLADTVGPGHMNAGVVIDPDGVTVIDTLLSRAENSRFARSVEALGYPIPRCVVTTSHVEATAGMSAFWRAAMYGTPQTSALLDQPADPDIHRRLHPTFARDIQDEPTSRPISHEVTDTTWLSETAYAALTSGQQFENLIVVVPDAGVCFAGALCCFGVVPAAFDGDPARWAETLDEIAALAPIIVPGQGPIGGAEEAATQSAYLRAVVAAEGDLTRLAPGPWMKWPGQERHVANVERAALLAAGDPSIPPSLLASLGLGR